MSAAQDEPVRSFLALLCIELRSFGAQYLWKVEEDGGSLAWSNPTPATATLIAIRKNEFGRFYYFIHPLESISINE